jgi:hypothetical protein
MHDDRFTFNRRAVRPIVCLSEGWQLIKEDYWFFVGMSFVALLIMYLVPFGIMIGPMMCGMHVCLFRQEIGRRYSFEMLFDGFDYFGQSLLVTMLWYWPTVLLLIIWYVMTIAGTVGAIITLQAAQGGQADPGVLLVSVAGVAGVFTLGLFGAVMIVEMLFLFTYPLLVDRDMSGGEAVLLSIKATFRNFWGVLGLILLITLISLVAALPCYLGLPFVAPLVFAMVTVAYRQVFPREDRRAPLRPELWDEEKDGPAETGIQTEPKKRRSDSHVKEG